MAGLSLSMPIPTVPNKPLTSFKSLSFDIYGTLIDWETSMVKHFPAFLHRLPRDSPYKHADSDGNARSKFLTFFNEQELPVMQGSPEKTYDIILTETYFKMAAAEGINVDDEIEQEGKAFGRSVGEWIAFPDTVDAMKRLGKYYKLVPLSNVDRESFKRTNANALKGVNFWRVYTAQDIGSYKPDLKNFQYLLKHLDEDDKSEGGTGISKEQDLHVAQSLLHDHVPTKKMGMASVWISRKGAGYGSESAHQNLHLEGQVGYGWRFNTLGELADEVERQWAQ